MTNKFYQPGAKRAEKVGDLFAAVAPRYDLINDWQSLGLHRWWKRELVKRARIEPGDKALDVCCGTGDLALRLAQAGAEVTGLDFSAPMLDIARRRSADQGASVHWLEGDALRLPFADNLFDVVSVGYGLRNLASWSAGLAEMHRVARSGGRLLVLDFGKPDNALWRGLYFAYLERIVPWFGRLFCRDADTHSYILASLRDYPAQRGVAEKLAELGCHGIETMHFLGGAMSLSVAQKS